MFKMMTIEEARAIWKSMMLTDEELEEWLALKNNRRPEEDDPSIPKGCTIEIDTPEVFFLAAKYGTKMDTEPAKRSQQGG
jgi:hypothetical protein